MLLLLPERPCPRRPAQRSILSGHRNGTLHGPAQQPRHKIWRLVVDSANGHVWPPAPTACSRSETCRVSICKPVNTTSTARRSAGHRLSGDAKFACTGVRAGTAGKQNTRAGFRAAASQRRELRQPSAIIRLAPSAAPKAIVVHILNIQAAGNCARGPACPLGGLLACASMHASTFVPFCVLPHGARMACRGPVLNPTTHTSSLCHIMTLYHITPGAGAAHGGR